MNQMRREKKRKVWVTAVVHDPEDRQPDGRWERTIVQKKAPVREIRWKGLMIRIVICSMLQDSLSQNLIMSNTLKEEKKNSFEF